MRRPKNLKNDKIENVIDSAISLLKIPTLLDFIWDTP
jgi:hypothetical protein